MMNENTEVEYFAKRLMVGSCLLTLQQLDDESIDSIVTDPPYELGFMGKKWDASGIAYSLDLWTECLRVLKPGGHLLAFGGTRTSHRMVCAIEDAGFEIRDSIHWTYGSGFPKSLNVSKAIDKAAGTSSQREVIGWTNKGMPPGANKAVGHGEGSEPTPVTAPASPAAKQWSGWGTALKPSHEPIVVARKPLTGTVAGNVLEHGTGALNIDACRVGTEARTNAPCAAVDGGVALGGGWQTAAAPTTVAGRWPANTVLTHSADCQQTGTRTDDITLNGEGNDNLFHGNFQGGHDQSPKSAATPVFQCVPGCPAGELDQQSGVTRSGLMKAGTKTQGYTGPSMGKWQPGEVQQDTYADAGGASRFFTQANWDEEWDGPVALYVAKPSKKERNAGLTGTTPGGEATGRKEGSAGLDNARAGAIRTGGGANHHPTVKPVALMRHLIRLVTKPGGTVLDPFLGSGTTAVAAVLEGMDWRGCELTPEYLPIVKGRIAHAQQEVKKVKQQALPGVL